MVRIISAVFLFVLLLVQGVPAETTGVLSAREGDTTAGLKYVDHWLPEKLFRPRPTTATVEFIMLHFCSDVVQNPDDPYNVNRIVDIFTTAGVSAHYLIDREGVIHRFVPESRTAFHAGRGILPWNRSTQNKLNDRSIGIEMLCVSSWSDMKVFMSREKYDEFSSRHPGWVGYTPAQMAAVKGLVADIRSRNPEIPFDRWHIVGHQEYAPGRRSDPGELFDYSKLGLKPRN